MYHIEKGDYVNKYQRYENNPISAFIYKSLSTFGFRATDNQIEFAGSTDSGTMSYILDDTDVTKFTIEYTNTAGEGNVYLNKPR